MIRRVELVLSILLFAALGYVAFLNTGQRVTIDLGFLVLYRVPVSVLLFGALLAGMLLMFLAGLRNDFRVRRLLRERLERLDHEP